MLVGFSFTQQVLQYDCPIILFVYFIILFLNDYYIELNFFISDNIWFLNL